MLAEQNVATLNGYKEQGGVRTIVTMMYGMRRTGARYGVTSIGGGGGIGTATVFERA